MHRVRAATVSAVLAASLWSAAPARADDCGLAVSAQGPPKASDALAILRTAVGSRQCDLCICDVDASGKTTASDALATLKAAVGQSVELRCVACAVTETIGAAGGTIATDDGSFEIEIPAGALGQAVQITITGRSPALLDDSLDDLDLKEAFLIEPGDLEFDVPVTMRVRSDAEVSGDGTVTADLPAVYAIDGITAASAGTAAGAAAAEPVEGEIRLDMELHRAIKGWQMSRMHDAFGWSNNAQVSARLPETLPLDVEQEVSVRVKTYINGVKVRYQDTTAEGFVPTADLPLVSDFVALPSPGQHSFLYDYVCDVAGEQPYEAEVVLETIGGDFPIQTVRLSDVVQCGILTVFRSGFEFTDGCAGMVLPFAQAPSGAKVACTGGSNTENGVNVMLPSPDPESEDVPPLAELLYGGSKVSLPTYKVVLMPAPGDGLADAVLAAGAALQLWRYDTTSGNLVDVFPALAGTHSFTDVSHPVLAPNTPGALLLDASANTASFFQYDGSVTPSLPQQLLGPSSFDGVGIVGQLSSARIRTATGPLLGVSLGNGQLPGTIFFHTLANPAAKVTVLGDAGIEPKNIDCDAALCAITNAASDSLTLLEWTGVGTPQILDTVPVGDQPDGVRVFALGGSRHLVVSAARGDDALDLTIIDTADFDILESSTQMALPEGCSSPTSLSAMGNGSVVVNCTIGSTFAVMPAIVPSN